MLAISAIIPQVGPKTQVLSKSELRNPTQVQIFLWDPGAVRSAWCRVCKTGVLRTTIVDEKISGFDSKNPWNALECLDVVF